MVFFDRKSLCVLVAIMWLVNLIGCKSQSQFSEPVFQDRYSATGEILIPADSLKDPWVMAVVDHYLIVGNNQGSPILEVYDLVSKNRVATLLERGNGPLEFLMPGNIQSGNGEFYVPDIFKQKLFKYNLHNIRSEGFTYPEVIFDSGDHSFLISKIVCAADNIIAPSQDPRGRLLFLNQDKEELGYFVDYPSKDLIDKNLTDHQMQNYTHQTLLSILRGTRSL